MMASSAKENGTDGDAATDTCNGWLEVVAGPTGTSTCRIELVPVSLHQGILLQD